MVWCDGAGVTCRRWNWRQGRRTHLTEQTSSALFILDALDPVSDADVHGAADDLVSHLMRFGSHVSTDRRLLTAGGS